MHIYVELGDADGKTRIKSELARIFNERGQSEYLCMREEVGAGRAYAEEMSRMSALLASGAIEIDTETKATVAKLLNTALSRTPGARRSRIRTFWDIREALLEEQPDSQPPTGDAAVDPARLAGHEEPEQP